MTASRDRDVYRERQIGEKFFLEGRWYKVVPGVRGEDCTRCDAMLVCDAPTRVFSDTFPFTPPHKGLIGRCSSAGRTDRRDVKMQLTGPPMVTQERIERAKRQIEEQIEDANRALHRDALKPFCRQCVFSDKEYGPCAECGLEGERMQKGYEPTDEVIEEAPPVSSPHDVDTSPFHAILKRMGDLHDAKNHDYSPEGMFGNFAESEKVGVPAWKGAFIRLQDKYTRSCNLIGGKEARVLDEKLEDTLLDMANYAVIVLCLMRGG